MDTAELDVEELGELILQYSESITSLFSMLSGVLLIFKSASVMLIHDMRSRTVIVDVQRSIKSIDFER